MQGIALRLLLNLSVDGDNGWVGTLDSPDQGATGLAISEITFDDRTRTLSLALPNIGAHYRGTLDDAGVLRGVWVQGAELPLDFVRVEGETGLKRPQEPTPPFPYTVEAVRFGGPGGEHTLAGTLTLPEGDGPFPAAILITGSGPQDRDETLFGHKPFWVIADDLTRRGVAVLRYDDRGVGGSTGDFAGATHLDFAEDARAAATYLRSDPRIDKDRLGLIGHSEGGLIAPLVVANDQAIAFVVLLAAPGVPLDHLLITQFERQLYTEGIQATDPRFVASITDLRAVFDLLLSASNQEEIAKVRDEVHKRFTRIRLRSFPGETSTKLSSVDAAAVEQQVDTCLGAWFRTLLAHDPGPALRALDVPVLALSGSLDVQVDPQANPSAMEDRFAESGHPDATVTVLPGLNHLLQPATTGQVAEYGQIETTVDPAALEAIGAWLETRFVNE
ncbi:MAG: alpha/beta fold hydrolase [Planctomycetota bacterium]